MEDLEETHIEWVSPDGKMKQCYNVQTLIKIACKGGKNELLQPPHFRAPMSRSLKEQIEEKFPGIISKLKKSQNPNGQRLFDENDIDEETMENYFQRYGDAIESVKYNWMSDIGDLYVCPLCFSYLSDLLDIENGTSDNDDEMEDPLEILTHQGIEIGAVALATKQAEMRTHLSTVHKIPKKYLTKKAGCTDVLKRFTLRDSDGLIQQYCHSKENIHHKTYYIGESSLNRGRYNALYYTVLQKAENLFPELFSQLPIWTLLEKQNTNEAKEYCDGKGLAYFRSLISQWSTEESALDHNFIANEDSFDEVEESSSEEDEHATMNFHCDSRNSTKGNGQSSSCSSSSTKKGRRGTKQKASTPHLYFTQSMRREEQDMDELEWEAERYTSLARRRGLRANLYGSDGDTSNHSSSSSKSIKSSRKKRSIARALSLYKEGQQVLVFYRGDNSAGKWYDAKILSKGRNSMKVVYAIDQSEERIYTDSDGSFNSRIKVKPSSTKNREARDMLPLSTFEDQNDEASVEFNEDEEIVSTPATGSKAKSHKRRRLRLETSSSDDDDAVVDLGKNNITTHRTSQSVAPSLQVSSAKINSKRKKPRLFIEDSDDDDDDVRPASFFEEEDDGDNSSSSDDCL